MSSEFRRQAIEVFEAVRDLPSEERTAALERMCGNDGALLEETRRLLDADAKEETFGLFRFAEALVRVDPDWDPAFPPGTRIGNYVVEYRLPKGAMGRVFRAEQASPRRKVALKVLPPGARFTSEPEILARLNHRSIAQVYESGECEEPGDGRIFFAMEYVEGSRDLVSYSRDHGLTTEAKLELFGRVCDGVLHAHQRGVIHQDLKPSNILVDPHGNPKIIDFGVAVLTGRDVPGVSTDHPVVAGTPPYISPEQFLGAIEEVDVRSDVYALGVVLHELLSGELPWDVEGRSITEILGIVTEREPRALPVAGKNGDLQGIVARAMARDKDSRYETVAQLRDDIRRYQEDRPISSRLDERIYVWRKFLRRKPLHVGGGAALFLALAAVIFLASRAERARLQVQARQAGQHLERGWNHLDDGEVLAGFTYLSEALHLMPRGEERQRESLKLAARLQDLGAHSLALELLDGVPFERLEASEQVRAVIFRGRAKAALGNLEASLAELQRACRMLEEADDLTESAARLESLAKRLGGFLPARSIVGPEGLQSPDHAEVLDLTGDGRDELVCLQGLDEQHLVHGVVWRWGEAGFQDTQFEVDLRPYGFDGPESRPLEMSLIACRPTESVPADAGVLLLHVGRRNRHAGEVRTNEWRLIRLEYSAARETLVPRSTTTLPGAAIRSCILGCYGGRSVLAVALWHPMREVWFLDPGSLERSMPSLEGLSDPTGLAFLDFDRDGSEELCVAQGPPETLGLQWFRLEEERWRAIHSQPVGRVDGLHVTAEGASPTLLTVLKDPRVQPAADVPEELKAHQGLVQVEWLGDRPVARPCRWDPPINTDHSSLIASHLRGLGRTGVLCLVSFHPPRYKWLNAAAVAWAHWPDGGWPLGRAQRAFPCELDGDPTEEILLLQLDWSWIVLGAATPGGSHSPATEHSQPDWGPLLDRWQSALERDGKSDWKEPVLECLRYGLAVPAYLGLQAVLDVDGAGSGEEAVLTMRDDLALLTFSRRQEGFETLGQPGILLDDDARLALQLMASGKVARPGWTARFPVPVAQGGNPGSSRGDWDFEGFVESEVAHMVDPIGIRSPRRIGSPGEHVQTELSLTYGRTYRATWKEELWIDPKKPFRFSIDMQVRELDYAMRLGFYLRPVSDRNAFLAGFELSHDRPEFTPGDVWGAFLLGPSLVSDKSGLPGFIKPRGGGMLRIEVIGLPGSDLFALRIRRRDDGPLEPDLLQVHVQRESTTPEGPYYFSIESEAERDGPLAGIQPMARLLIDQGSVESFSNP